MKAKHLLLAAGPVAGYLITGRRIENRAWQLYDALTALEGACAREGIDLPERQWARDAARGFNVDFGPDTDRSRLDRQRL